MANKNRLAKHYLKDLHLSTDELYRQSFEGLLRYVDANAELHERIGHSQSIKQDPLRLGQTPLLHFHSSAFASISEVKSSQTFRLSNAYLGLFGQNGPLPTHITEYAIQRRYKHKDTTLIAFCDMFHHRFISLFYRAWADSQPAISHDFSANQNQNAVTVSTFSRQDTFAKRVSVFSGTIDFDRRARNAIKATQTDVDQYFAGLLSMKNRSAGMLQQILEEYLNLPVKINQFVGRWLTIPSTERCRLGGQNAGLGSTAVIGRSSFQRCFNLSINIGPLNFEDYATLIASPRTFKQMRVLASKAIGSEYELKFEVSLAQGQKKQSKLGQSSLGVDSWVCSKTDITSKAHIALTI